MNADIERVTVLVNAMSEAADRIEQIETSLALEKAKHRRIAEEDLPELMRELELQTITLTNGLKVDVEDLVNASITEERKPEAHEWLRAHGFGGLIKSVVSVAFARGEEKDAQKLLVQLSKKYAAVATEAVHPQTLKAFVREQVAEGKHVPEDLFGIFPFSRAKVTAPKPKKAR